MAVATAFVPEPAAAPEGGRRAVLYSRVERSLCRVYNDVGGPVAWSPETNGCEIGGKRHWVDLRPKRVELLTRDHASTGVIVVVASSRGIAVRFVV